MNGYKAEASEVRKNLNDLQVEYNMVRNELRETVEKNGSYKRLCENIEAVTESETAQLQEQVAELSKQLEDRVTAYKTLNDKYRNYVENPVRRSVDVRRELRKGTELPKQVSKLRSSEESAIASLIKDELPRRKLEVAKSIAMKKKEEVAVKTPEQSQATIGELRRRIYEDVDTKRTLQEIIKLRENTVAKQQLALDSMRSRLETNKADIQFLQSQLSGKNAEVKALAESIGEVMRGLEKYKKPGKDRMKNPRYLVKQRLKKETEPKPYLLGPVMEDELD